MTNLHFCSFASTDILPSLKRIGNEAKKFNLFNRFFLFTEKKLPAYGKKRIKNIIQISNSKRGFGYWAWKPIIINSVLTKIKENDILVYSDAGSEFNVNGKAKLLEYIELAKKYDIWVISQSDEFTDVNWTKADTIKYFTDNIIEQDKNTEFQALIHKGQLEAGTIILKKNKFTQDLLREWENLMTLDNLHLFDDSPSIKKNIDTFKENRHDQSILSLLLKTKHFCSSPSELFYSETTEGWKELEKTSPFLHRRNIKYTIKHFTLCRKILSKIINRINAFINKVIRNI